MNSTVFGRFVLPFTHGGVPAEKLNEGLFLSGAGYRTAWVGALAHFDVAEDLVPEALRAEVVTGPHEGHDFVCGNTVFTPSLPFFSTLCPRQDDPGAFYIPSRWISYRGTDTGVDVIRLWDDLDRDGTWDTGEPQGLATVRWIDEVIGQASLGDSFSSGEAPCWALLPHLWANAREADHIGRLRTPWSPRLGGKPRTRCAGASGGTPHRSDRL